MSMGIFPEDSVFPARAGMNRSSVNHGLSRQCVPRASGDEPYRRLAPGEAAKVFPARAGMNRQGIKLALRQIRVPRASGDEPDRCPSLSRAGQCSPRERG